MQYTRAPHECFAGTHAPDWKIYLSVKSYSENKSTVNSAVSYIQDKSKLSVAEGNVMCLVFKKFVLVEVRIFYVVNETNGDCWTMNRSQRFPSLTFIYLSYLSLRLVWEKCSVSVLRVFLSVHR